MTDKACELFFGINLLLCKLGLGVFLAAAEFLSLMNKNDVYMKRWLNFSTEFNLHQAGIGLFEFPRAFLTLRQRYQWYSCRNNENKVENHWSSQPSISASSAFLLPPLPPAHCAALLGKMWASQPAALPRLAMSFPHRHSAPGPPPPCHFPGTVQKSCQGRQ